ncbi:histidine phosphatase family protein [Kineococcus terrestris]|uniref:histidine phosphatase family protein n=1 Tax=Kineococcus terrestris TaxID=2044856 RepID=UPI0034DB4BE0
MTRIALVRHGETDWNLHGRLQGRSDVPLNDTGRAQARALAPWFTGGAWDAVVSSPLARARETAEIVAAGADLRLTGTDDALVERDFGEAEGMDFMELAERWPDGSRPGMEADDVVGARGATAFERLAGEHAGRDLVIVCHGTLIRLGVLAWTGTTVERIVNATVTLVEGGPGAWRVTGVNLGGPAAG